MNEEVADTVSRFRKPPFTIISIAQNGRFPWIWIYAFTALIMAIAAGVFTWLASESRRQAGEGRTANAPPVASRHIPAERLDLLSRFQPPAYKPSAGDSSEFQSAMKAYTTQEYGTAIGSFQAILRNHPDFTECRFYLAICQLLTNDRASGIAELRNVVAAGQTPYLEPARFYLAKGLLGSGDIRGADVQLRVLAEMHGSLEKQAQILLSQIVQNR